MYLIALLLPPLALLMVNRPGQAIFNLIAVVTIVGWPIASIHAVLMVMEREQNRRHDEMLHALAQQHQQLMLMIREQHHELGVATSQPLQLTPGGVVQRPT